MDSVSFIRMEDGTKEEYLHLSRLREEHKQANLAESLLNTLTQMKGPTLGYKVDRYEHSLQTASRALRDEADEETVVAALLHDIGDVVAPDNHADLAACVLRPYVSEPVHWLVKHHGIFQGYYFWHHHGEDRDTRERYRGHPHFERTALFCERWDQTAFDPDYDTIPLETFEPRVRRIFARPPSYSG